MNKITRIKNSTGKNNPARSKTHAELIGIAIICTILIGSAAIFAKVASQQAPNLISGKNIIALQRQNFMIAADPPLFAVLEPGKTAVYTGWSVIVPATTIRVNQDSFRGREYSTEKPAGTYRIIVLGDSNTMGSGVEENETYPFVLEKRLIEREDGWNYEVLNMGVQGYTAGQEVEFYLRKGKKYSPDLIIIGYWGNDNTDAAWQREQKTRFLSNSTLMAKYRLKNEADVLTAIETTLKEEEIQRVGFQNHWNKTVIGPYKRLDSSQGNASVILFVIGSEGADQKKALLQINEAISFKTIFSKVSLSDNKYKVHPQDGHPNRLAHQEYATEIYRFMEEELIIAKEMPLEPLNL